LLAIFTIKRTGYELGYFSRIVGDVSVTRILQPSQAGGVRCYLHRAIAAISATSRFSFRVYDAGVMSLVVLAMFPIFGGRVS